MTGVVFAQSWSRTLDAYYRGQEEVVIRTLKDDALNSETRLLFANALFQNKQYAAADGMLRTQDYRNLVLQPYVLYLRLQIAVENKQLVLAQQYYQSLLRLKTESDPLVLRAAILLARCYVSLDNRFEAQRLLVSVLKKTSSPEITYEVQRLLFDSALVALNKEGAREALTAMCLSGAGLREEPAMIAKFRIRFGEEFVVEDVFKTDGQVLVRAQKLMEETRFQDVIALLTARIGQGIKTKPEAIRIQYLLSEAYYLQSEYLRALESYQRTLSFGDTPSDLFVPIHIRLVECLLRGKDFADARRYMLVLESGPESGRAAGYALYIRYLIVTETPVKTVMEAVSQGQVRFPQSPEIREVALEAWHYADANNAAMRVPPPVALPVADFFAVWRPKHFQVSEKAHLFTQLPLSYTTLMLLESEGKKGRTISEDAARIIRAGFGTLILPEGTEENVILRAQLLSLMSRPYQSITLLRRYLMTAPRRASVWAGLDQNWLRLLYPRPMMEWVGEASRKSGIEQSLILSVIRTESTFNTEIKSAAGALGLMQLMPDTAREVAQRFGVAYKTKQDLLDPQMNMLLGALYLSEQLRLFKGDLVLAIAAYNAGPTAVRRWTTLNPELLNKKGRAQIALLPYAETRQYVTQVLDGYAVYGFLAYKDSFK